MKFKNKKTGAVVDTVLEDYYNRNPQWEKVEKETKKEMTIAEIKATLTELGIEYDENAKKADLLTLLPQKS